MWGQFYTGKVGIRYLFLSVLDVLWLLSLGTAVFVYPRKDIVLRMKSLPVKSLMLLCSILFVSIFALNGNHLAYALGYQHHHAQSAQEASSQGTRTFWVQVMDSCKQALPGAYFAYQVDGTTINVGPTPGTKPRTVANSPVCPLQRGRCVNATSTGCLAFTIPIPASGSTTYTIKETQSPSGYMPCTGGSVCPGGPEVITLKIKASGRIAATVFNVYPDRKTVTWPTSGAPYQGTLSDPAVLHNFGIGTINCDGDHDADDHLTGGRGTHCDSDDDSTSGAS